MPRYRLDPKNARTHPERNRNAIGKSLRELGAGRSIVVDKDGVVIGGNCVYEKALELGLGTEVVHTSGDKLVVVVRDDLATGDPRRKALALADNQIALLAEWDEVKLEEILGELGDIDLDVMGFEKTNGTIQEPQNPATLVDRAEELQKKWKVKRGQIFEISGKAGMHRVMSGDSTDKGDVALLLDGAEPYLMVTDPPYGVEYDPQWRVQAGVHKRSHGTSITGDDRVDWSEVYALLPCRIAYIWHGARNTHIVAESLGRIGFNLVCCIIWVKDLQVLGRGDYHWQHEPCWYAVKRGSKYQWIGGRQQTTVWEISTIHSFARGHNAKEWGLVGHGTQKPVECMARPIHNHEGDVCDPFLGSGTTIIAAEQEGRICYGMEIEPKYVAVTLERLSALGLKPVKRDG